MDLEEVKDLCMQKISDMSECVSKISSNIEDLKEAFKEGKDSETLMITESHISFVEKKISRYSYLENELYQLFQDFKVHEKTDENDEGSVNRTEKELQPSSSAKQQSLSIKPKESATSSIQAFAKATKSSSLNPTYLEKYQSQMAEYYHMANTDYKIIDFNGFYPKVHFVQGANPNEIKEAYNFGMLSEIYLTSPDFPELSKLPDWIKKGVIDNFTNNPYITMEDVLRINCFSAGPDYDEKKIYPSYNLMILGRSFRDKLTVSNQRKVYSEIKDEEVQRKRAIELFSIKTRMENIRKRPFRTYSGDQSTGLLVTQLARHTPESAEKYLLSTIKIIHENLLYSSSGTQRFYCQKSHRNRQVCRFCRQIKEEDKMSE